MCSEVLVRIMKQHNQDIAIEWNQKLKSPGMTSGELINDFFDVSGYALMHEK